MAAAPPGYTTPPFPSLPVQLRDSTPTKRWSLFYVADIWRFTVLWTLVLYAIFHLGAAALAVAMHAGRGGRTGPKTREETREESGAGGGGWMRRRRRAGRGAASRYLALVPVVYVVVAGIEGLFAGSIVGAILGAVYFAGEFEMNTWIPFVWGWINVLVLVISSFSIQGGL